jgi:uncharacterized protein YkwD
MKVILLLAIVSLAAVGFIFLLDCGYEPPGPTADDTVDTDDDNTGPNECGYDYSKNPGCDDADEGCQMAWLINQDREAYPDESDCAPAIKWSDELAQVARQHSQDMCDTGVFDHVVNGKDPFDRMHDDGIDYVAAGENIAMGTDGYYTVTDLEKSFMNEPECQENHRGNILSRDFTHVGVGVVHCDDGNMYVTQDFASFVTSDLRTDPNEYCSDLGYGNGISTD